MDLRQRWRTLTVQRSECLSLGLLRPVMRITSLYQPIAELVLPPRVCFKDSPFRPVVRCSAAPAQSPYGVENNRSFLQAERAKKVRCGCSACLFSQGGPCAQTAATPKISGRG